MIPPEERIKFSRQPHEKSRDRKALIASLVVGLMLAAAVEVGIYLYGMRHPS